LLEPGFDGIHALIGAFHRLFKVSSVAWDGRYAATHAKQHLPVGFVGRVPNHHPAESADLITNCFEVA
jgi:hypothetical protein